jgi:type II pantothenate kinase
MTDAGRINESLRRDATILPEDVVGADAGLTITKIVRASRTAFELSSHTAQSLFADEGWPWLGTARRVGATGARIDGLVRGAAVVRVPEIEAAARGTLALMRAEGSAPEGDWVLALMGTGTAFAAIRDGRVSHLGGTALGGGSFSGIARRIAPGLDYGELVARAARGDRRNVDTMIADAYPDGIGRLGSDLTAAHLTDLRGGSVDDFLAGLMNLHGESIAQIGASRARIAGAPHLVLAGGFAHGNVALVASVTAMAAMFGVSVAVAPSPRYAGAIGAALVAAEAEDQANTQT